MTDAAPPPPKPVHITDALHAARPRALFLAFLSIALSGFGGVLPFARRMLVDQRGWLTAEDFTETLSLCQGLPGPNVVNLSIVVGSRACGWRGSLAALSGLIGAPIVIVIALGMLWGRFGALAEARRAITGVAAGAAGLVIATAARMAEPLLRRRALAAAPFIAAAFVAVGVLRLPLGLVILGLAPFSIALAWRRPA
ncbi:MAG TPA: chromate transporter [Caulobacteraceae bacterium]|nr:chromate transporter [Caulobacteraceae bacterium]